MQSQYPNMRGTKKKKVLMLEYHQDLLVVELCRIQYVYNYCRQNVHGILGLVCRNDFFSTSLMQRRVEKSATLPRTNSILVHHLSGCLSSLLRIFHPHIDDLPMLYTHCFCYHVVFSMCRTKEQPL